MLKCRFLLIVCLGLAISGCAGHQMALTKEQTKIDLTRNSLALLSVKISNQYKPGFQFDIVSAVICPQHERCDGRPAMRNLHRVKSPYKIKSVQNSFNEYLLSFELQGGAYNIYSIGAIYDHFPIAGGGTVPLNFDCAVKPNSVVYLGHLDIVMRERKNDSERRAGPVTPLIDQAAVGASSGTYDVLVEDRFEEDLRVFMSEYPALQKVQVGKSILPQWIRPENQPAK